MRRRILLLTAVVMTAVMLSGCVIPFLNGIRVSYKYPDGVFKNTVKYQWIKRNDPVKLELKFDKDEEELDAEDFAIETDRKLDKEPKIENLVENDDDEGKVIGIVVLIDDIGRRSVTVKVILSENVE